MVDGMKKPVMSVLREMKIGDVESWPIERVESVRICTYRMAMINRRKGWKFSRKTEGLNVIVTRIA